MKKIASVFGLSLFGMSLTAGAASAEEHLQATSAALDAMVHPVSQEAAERIAAAFGLGEVSASGADDVVAMLDEAGVDKAVMQAVGFFAPVVPDDEAVSAENDFVADEVAKNPERLVGFCGINPLLPGALDEIDRCLDRDGMVGIKLNPVFSGMDLADDENVAALSAVFGKAQEHDAPVQMHMLGPTDQPLSWEAFGNLANIIQQHQDVRVSHSHCGGLTDEHVSDQWLQRMKPNPETAFLDLSLCLEHFRDAPSSKRELIVWRLRQWGVDNLLFSSDHVRILDFPTTARALETLTQYPFTQDEIDVITSDDGSAWLGGS